MSHLNCLEKQSSTYENALFLLRPITMQGIPKVLMLCFKLLKMAIRLLGHPVLFIEKKKRLLTRFKNE